MSEVGWPAHSGEDDFEPIAPDEALDHRYGTHTIVHAFERVAEIALAFDLRWVTDPEPERVIAQRLACVFKAGDGVCTLWGFVSIEDRADFLEKFAAAMEAIRPLDLPPPPSLLLVTAELFDGAEARLLQQLAEFPPFAGYADVSWPSELRSILQQDLIPCVILATEHNDDPAHWIHDLPH